MPEISFEERRNVMMPLFSEHSIKSGVNGRLSLAIAHAQPPALRSCLIPSRHPKNLHCFGGYIRTALLQYRLSPRLTFEKTDSRTNSVMLVPADVGSTTKPMQPRSFVAMKPTSAIHGVKTSQ